ncbi:hypothetical protein HHL22_16750 [Hymenobacter sp. RP-2-7]|uniref:Tail specific protease domain-containing protein n=1 Tax=Hymenobacter polaris TaxID=2682546 RepID=A0A7Y0FNR2_9BACT|nr:S41 family peptidase [Hymenobacter polaris]NML66856.1 hypothetical protein [Hymenobacter polaris]
MAAPSARYLGEGLAYMAVPEFTSDNNERQIALAGELQTLIRQLDTEHTVTGWVVDLCGNGGGNMRPMLAGLGALTGTGTLAYFVAGRWKKPITYREMVASVNGRSQGARLSPAQPLRRPASPVAVLIGPGTGSSGEVTAMAFIGRPATWLFGQPSAGYTTANNLFRLPDGAELDIAMVNEADRPHRVRTGPLVSDELVPAAPAGAADATLDAAASWLRQPAPAGKW